MSNDLKRYHIKQNNSYWKRSKQLIGLLLSIWALISFGCSIIWVEQLDSIQFFGFKLGFWIAQQGSIICFLLLTIIYVICMNDLDKRHRYFEE